MSGVQHILFRALRRVNSASPATDARAFPRGCTLLFRAA